MKLAAWNVNSLKVRLPQLLDWLASAQPDVICLQETKLEDHNFPQAEIEAALLPIQSALADLPEMAATEIGATRILNGNPGQVLGHAEFGEEVWVSRNGRALCIGRYMGGEVQPARVFNLD